jgi:hypothetical protein
MQIDKAGNYYIARDDMSFRTYDIYQYRDTTGVNPDATYDTKINFKPYTVSNASGWCGSVLGTVRPRWSGWPARSRLISLRRHFDINPNFVLSTELILISSCAAMAAMTSAFRPRLARCSTTPAAR